MNKDDFYLNDVELCKQLEPILKKKEIKPDMYWFVKSDIKELVGAFDQPKNWLSGANWIKEEYIPTYRKDSLEAAINWDKSAPIYRWLIENAEAKDLLYAIACNLGQQSLRALAQLIILLDKEQIE